MSDSSNIFWPLLIWLLSSSKLPIAFGTSVFEINFPFANLIFSISSLIAFFLSSSIWANFALYVSINDSISLVFSTSLLFSSINTFSAIKEFIFNSSSLSSVFVFIALTNAASFVSSWLLILSSEDSNVAISSGDLNIFLIIML